VIDRRSDARTAGLAYLGIILLGPFTLIYIPQTVFASDDAGVLARSLVAHAGLMRLGIYCDMLAGVLLLGVGYALYRLFKSVAPEVSLMPLVLGGIIVVPMEFLNELNQFAALTFAQDRLHAMAAGAFLQSAFTAAVSASTEAFASPNSIAVFGSS